MRIKVEDLQEGEITLNDGSIQKYKIDEKQKHIAKTKKGYIIVNKEFLGREDNQKKTIIYHERGHLKKFNREIRSLSTIFYSIFMISGIVFLFKLVYYLSLFKLIPYSGFMDDLGHINIGLVVVVFLSSFIIFIQLNYLSEILSDFNAVKNMGVQNFNDSVIDYYRKKNLKDSTFHPHWKLRKRIMEELD